MRRKAVSLALAAVMFSSACSTTGSGPGAGPEDSQPAQTTADGEPLTPEEAQLREDAHVFNVTVVEGSLVGAGLGILAGVLIGATTGKVENMVAYGIAGGVTGGILGGVDGYMTAKQQEAGNNRVRMVQAMTRDVEKENENLEKLIASSNKILQETEQRSEEIRQQTRQRTANLQQVRSEQRRMEENRNVMQASLDSLKKRRDNYQQAALKTGGDTRELDAQIQRLNQQIAQLEKNVVAMNEAIAVSKV